MAKEKQTRTHDKHAASIPVKMQEHLQGVLETQGGGTNKYGHRLGKQAAFIDEQLEQGKGVDQIVEAWNREHPDGTEMTRTRVVDEVRHLLTEHKVKRFAKEGQQTEPQVPQE